MDLLVRVFFGLWTMVATKLCALGWVVLVLYTPRAKPGTPSFGVFRTNSSLLLVRLHVSMKGRI